VWPITISSGVRHTLRYYFAIPVIAVLAGCGPGAASPTQPTAIAAADLSFRLFGVVRDTIGRPVPRAILQIVSDQHKGATVLADDNGRFTFAEPFNLSVRVRASQAGYLDDTRAITFTNMQNPAFTPYFQLQTAGPVVNIAGRLRLRFQIDLACAENVPAAFWTREYTAVVPPHSSFAVFGLDGGKFAPGGLGSYAGGNTVYASFFGQEMKFYLEDPPLVEVLSDSERFSIYGHASGEIDGAETSWPFQGTFSYCLDGEYNCEVCESAAHVLTLIRN
jgi:Carboxypeptidase regulatory-like domain